MPSIVVELGAVVVGLGFVYFAGEKVLEGYGSYRRERIAKAADPASPASASPGTTGIVGTVEAEDTLRTPLGGEKAVAFYIDTFVGGNEESFPYEDETVTKPFRVTGEGGSVTVDCDDLTIETTDDRTRTYSSGYFFADVPEDLPDEVVEFLQTANIPIPDGGRVGIEQKHIAVGDTAYVHGTVERENGVLTLTDDDGELFVTDKPPAEFVERRNFTLTGALGRAALLAGAGIVLSVTGIVLVLA